MTPDHSARDHATWSASASKRNFACPGALAMTKDLPNRTSEAADWGTCAHQIAEACLTNDTNADQFLRQRLKGKQYSFEVDDEMADCAQEFISYVRGRRAASGSNVLWIEQRFSLADLNPPFDAGGTGDAVIWLPGDRELEIVDLKGGRGVVVEAKGNPQLRTYALGAVLANPRVMPDTVRVTIVQPRAPHKDGRIRSEAFHVADLISWSGQMLEAMHAAKAASDAYPGPDRQVALEEWARDFLRPGEHCRSAFCGAAATCPALRMKVEAEVGLFFDPITDAPGASVKPNSGNPDERARRLDLLDMIDGWVKEVRAYEHRMAEAGFPATGYGLVEKTGREAWNDDAAATNALAVARAAGVAEDKILTPGKPRTPKQVREAIKKAGGDPSALAGLSSTSVTGTNLVRLDSTSRPAVNPAAQFFDPIKE